MWMYFKTTNLTRIITLGKRVFIITETESAPCSCKREVVLVIFFGKTEGVFCSMSTPHKANV